MGINNISWTSLELERIGGGNNIFKVRSSAPSQPFLLKAAKTRLQISPAAPLFIRPFLTYAAEQSVERQHCHSPRNSRALELYLRYSKNTVGGEM